MIFPSTTEKETSLQKKNNVNNKKVERTRVKKEKKQRK